MTNEQGVKGATQGEETEGLDLEPIIIDLGKKNRKQIRKLRKGKQCRLLTRVEDTIQRLSENPELGGGSRPIVVVVRQRPGKNKNRRLAKMWGMG